MKLRELVARVFEQQQMMSVRWLLDSEQVLECSLYCGRVREISSPYDPRHFARSVVDDRGEVVRDRAIATPNDRIAEGIGDPEIDAPDIRRHHEFIREFGSQRQF